MRIKHLFYLLLALPLVFAACENGSEGTDKKPEYKAELTLTSNATMDVVAEAGDYEITYTAKMVEVTREAAPATVEATCAAEWVTIGEVTDTKAAFSVAANEGEARETKIVVKYSTESFEVTVKQAAKGEEPNDPETVNFEAKYLVGEYFTDGDVGFYYLMFYDVEEDGYPAENATLYSISLFDEKYDGEWSELIPLPTGEFTFDATDSGEVGTFGCEDGGYIAPGMEAMLPFEDGDFVVNESGVTLNVTIDGVKHVVTLDGEPAIYNTDEPDAPDVAIEAEMASARRLTAAEFGFELYTNDFPILFESDEYSALVFFVGGENDTVLLAGDYTNTDYGIYLAGCAFGNEEVEYDLKAVTATVAVKEDVYSIEATMTDADGVVIHLTYEGEVEDMNPADKEPEVFEPKKVVASREASYPAGNFFLQLYVDEYRYHELEMYDTISPNTNYLSSGQYKMSEETIGSWSTYSNGVNTTCSLADAEVMLVNNADYTVTLVGFIKSEEGHYITFDWTGTVEGFKYEASGEDVNFTAQYFSYEHYDYDGVYNYWITLSDAAEKDVLGAVYYRFDLYSATLDTDNPRVPVGTYAFDIEDSCADGTMGVSYTYMESKTTDGIVVWLGSEGGTLTVTETGIEAVITYDDGSTHTITYTGDLSIELPEPEPVSTLTGDVTLDKSNLTIVTATSDAYVLGNGNICWQITIMEDSTNGNGTYLQLQLCTSTADSYLGTYTASNDYSTGTFIPGIVNEWGDVSSWYFDMSYYSKVAKGPLADGTITIAENADGTKSFTLDCTDGFGHAIKGTVTAR